MMDKQLKTMGVNALIEEIGACNSEESLKKLQVLTHSELEGQDNITREVVFKVFYYKSHLLTGYEPAFERIIKKNDRLANASKLQFYRNTIEVFKSLNISFLLQLLEAYQENLPIKDEQELNKTASSMAALMQLEGQLLAHAEDAKELRKSLKAALFAGVMLEMAVK